MKAIQYTLEDVKIMRSDVRDHPMVFDEDFSSDDVSIDINIDFNYRDEYIQNLLHIAYEYETKDSNDNSEIGTIVLGHFDILFTYGIKNYKDIFEDPKSKELLLLNILRISYATTRGIIFCETRGFAINDFYLIPVSTKDLYNSYLTESVNVE